MEHQVRYLKQLRKKAIDIKRLFPPVKNYWNNLARCW